jgi:transporter family protein
MSLALIAGLLGSIGGLCFVHSVSRGKASVVITMTALYPLVTIILSFFFLRETITLKQGIGIVFALLAMLFLAI